MLWCEEVTDSVGLMLAGHQSDGLSLELEQGVSTDVS